MLDAARLVRKPDMLSIRQFRSKTKMQTTFMQISNALSSIFNRSPFTPFTDDVECDANIQNISHSVVSLRQLRSTQSLPPRKLASYSINSRSGGLYLLQNTLFCGSFLNKDSARLFPGK
ncbi:hypothetical protein CDAR_255391 [Caerostris darwini]|uniref:Uncharacterized protein n=1 Tax=Caerostris darwini TaxID=1538125 RepID=A0AAV4V1P7_9ARAC|nr:hypothetical protein CDAR_255391 [Caerostris darwini]